MDITKAYIPYCITNGNVQPASVFCFDFVLLGTGGGGGGMAYPVTRILNTPLRLPKKQKGSL